MSKFSVDREMRRAKSSLRTGDFDEARRIYRSILDRFPDNQRARRALSATQDARDSASPSAPPENALNELVLLLQNGQPEIAASKAEAFASQFPSHFQFWTLLGMANERLKRLEKAEDAYNRAIALAPERAELHTHLGRVLRGQGKPENALECLRHALEIDPGSADAHAQMGTVLSRLGRINEAIQSYERAIELKPEVVAVRATLGLLHYKQRRFDDAIACFRGELGINPKSSEAHHGLGCVLEDQGKFGEAVKVYERALQNEPGSPSLLANLGRALRKEGRLPEAVAALDGALRVAPHDSETRAVKLRTQLEMCDWSAFDEFELVADKLGIEGEAAPPFALLVFEDDPDRQARRARNYAQRTFDQQALPLPAQPNHSSERIRIGYFSADFHDHPMLFLMSGLLREHDKSRFEIFAYSYGKPRPSAMLDQIKGYVDHFIDIWLMSDRHVVELVRQQGIDIAIDRKGYTENTRSQLFAHRLAPIQINYLAYPGTMGADFIDYLVADPVIVPQSDRRFYSEEILYLPNCYQPNDNQREIARTETTRADFGLPEVGFVFCCFNNNNKIGRREFDVWMNVLQKVEGSVLWLLESNRWAEENLRSEARQRGVEPDRLVFAPVQKHAEHLARHKHADLFIDTFNYNAHTTASDALWAGLPVVTKAGRQFAARVGASLLTALDLPELITETEGAYEALILELAKNAPRLASIKAKLIENRLVEPLFDTPRYARDFERALEEAYAHHMSE